MFSYTCRSNVIGKWTVTQYLKWSVGTQTLFGSQNLVNNSRSHSDRKLHQPIIIIKACQQQTVLCSAHFGMMRLSSKLTAMADFSCSDVSSAVICSLDKI